MVEEEDVICLLEEAGIGQNLTQLPRLVPEDREAPVLDVENMVFGVGIGHGQRPPGLVERMLVVLRGQQIAILFDQSPPLRDYGVYRPVDAFTPLYLFDITPDMAEGNREVIDPGPVEVVEASARGGVEPGILGLLHGLEPSLALVRLVHLGDGLIG